MRRFLLAGFGFCLIIGALWGYCAVRDRNLSRDFELVSVGMTEDQVRKVMGKPSVIEACGRLGGAPKECAQEFRFNTPYPVPYAWVVFIDSTGRAIGKDWYASW
jgi:hypothetical protein